MRNQLTLLAAAIALALGTSVHAADTKAIDQQHKAEVEKCNEMKGNAKDKAITFQFPTGVESGTTATFTGQLDAEETVIKGTWYTDEGTEFRPDKAIPMKPGEYMRHPAGGSHYDGALDEEVWIAISGYGPTSATVLDGGELFGRSRPAPGTN